MRVGRLTATLSRDSTPAPLKYALSLLGLMSPRIRLPLVELAEPAKAEVAAAIRIIEEDDKLPPVNGFASNVQPPDSVH
jgi:4-hydroxy-tetrahydrodipicolinate synthase